MATQPLAFEQDRTAVLIMDFSTRTVENAASDPKSVVERAVQVLEAARAAKIPVLHVMPRGSGESPVKIHPEVAPIADEITIIKERWGAFSTTGLDARPAADEVGYPRAHGDRHQRRGPHKRPDGRST